MLKPQTERGVTFLNGGIGEQEQNALRDVQGEYNLHLMLSIRNSGSSVIGAKVTIKDSNGRTVLDTVGGPSLFVKLKAGSYRVTADRSGHVISETVAVPNTHWKNVVFRFPVEKGD